jgi:hypothetical protein
VVVTRSRYSPLVGRTGVVKNNYRQCMTIAPEVLVLALDRFADIA